MRHAILGLLALAACSTDFAAPETYSYGSVHLRVAVTPGGTAPRHDFLVSLPWAELTVPRTGIDLVLQGTGIGQILSRITIPDTWCHPDRDSLRVEMTASDTAEVSYTVGCDPVASVIRVITATTVVDAGPDHLDIVTPTDTVSVAANDTTLVEGSFDGSTLLRLAAIPIWCTPTSSEANVPYRMTDTQTVTFQVGCGTAFRAVTLQLDALGVHGPPFLGITVNGTTPLLLQEGVDTTITVRVDQVDFRVDSLTRGCLALVDSAPRLQVDAGLTPRLDRLRIGCGRLSGLGERSVNPMGLLETGLDGRDTLVIAQGLQHPYDGALSRDGQWVVGEQYQYDFVNSRYEWRAYREAIQGGDFQLLHDWTPDRIIWPRWGPDDDHISYIEDWSAGPQRLVVRARDAATLDTIVLPDRRFVHAEWSPTGDRIALASWCVYPAICPTGITIASPGSTSPIATYPVAFTSGQMAWSPDGTRIAFVGPGGRIHVLRLADGTITQIATSDSPWQDESPEWDPSGELVGFLRVVPDENQQPFHWAFVAAADGGPERIVIQQRVYVGPFWQR